ncbi:MAG: YeeE/YedE family protein [Pseudomonadota bacterium]
MDVIYGPFGAAFVGLTGGVLLGLAARRGGFCTLGAIEDALYGGSWVRIRMWAMALAVAITGVFLLEAVGTLDLSQTIYAQISWNPAAAILGGLIFGYGMAIAGNCGFGALARLGGGDLRSFVIVLVTGIAAYATLSGPLARLRVMLFPQDAVPVPQARGYAHFVADAIGLPVLVPALLLAALLALWALASSDFRRTRRAVIWSVVAGAAVVIGWAGTSTIATHSFDNIAVVSHSFTAPLGETIFFLMTSSAGGLSFAVGSVVGVLAGALIGSISRGHFRWEACDDPQELGRQILGGALMGIGGVLALGCSVGQGMTAFSTLAYSAPVVLASIVAGAAFGLRQLIRGFEPAE